MLKRCFVHVLICLLRVVANSGLPAVIGLWLSVPTYARSGGKLRIYRTFYGQWRMNRGIRRGERQRKRREKYPHWARFICFCYGHTIPSPRIERGANTSGSISLPDATAENIELRIAGYECFRCGKSLEGPA